MEAVLKVLITIEPVLIGAISLAALVVVPVIVKAVLEKLDRDQQRFAYDVAKGIVEALDLIDDKTPTKIDDALLKVAMEVEEQLGRKLKMREQAAVRNAVITSSGRRILAGK